MGARQTLVTGRISATPPRPTVVCAWCQRTMVPGGRETSHGLCRDCQAKHFPGTARAQ